MVSAREVAVAGREEAAKAVDGAEAPEMRLAMRSSLQRVAIRDRMIKELIKIFMAEGTVHPARLEVPERAVEEPDVPDS